jgi:hypothetical protein
MPRLDARAAIKGFSVLIVLPLLWSGGGLAQMTHGRGDAQQHPCAGPALRCASTATPTFAADGSLWLVWAAAGRVSVARSTDLGRSFTPAVAVNPEPMRLDTGPDERPKIAVDKDGRVGVAFAIFKDSAFNGQVLYTRSSDGGLTFAPLRPITGDPESQRFETIAFDPEGALFAAWLDKRKRALARAKGDDYTGASLAFAWSKDGAMTFSESRIAKDGTCECCRLGLAFAGAGRPVVMFRNIFGNSARDHAVTTFADPATPGPIYRVSADGWDTDVCPHHGPSLSLGDDGTYHATWFTEGRARQGLFYARSTDGGRTFSEPMPIGDAERSPSRPFVLACPDAVWMVWKEFDGEHTTVNVMNSRDHGKTWSVPRALAQTSDASDHPLLINSGNSVFLSWMTRADGYRLLSVEAAP